MGFINNNNNHRPLSTNRITTLFENTKVSITKIICFFCEKKKNIMLFYILGSISTYIFAETIKTTTLIHLNTESYRKCIQILSKSVKPKSTIDEVCDILKKHDNFTKFATNLTFMVGYIYMLMNEIVKDIKISWKYWIICHLSSLLYSLVCEVNFFKFSYSEGFHYTPGQTEFNIILFSCIFILLLKQIYNKKSVKLKILFNFTAAYILLYLLIRSGCSNPNEVKFHFHHAFTSSALSLFFTDIENSYIDKYCHAILLGIIIQGFSFYTITEIFIFNTPYISSPTFDYMVKLHIVYIIGWISFMFLVYRYNRKYSSPTSSTLRSLSDIINDINLNERLIEENILLDNNEGNETIMENDMDRNEEEENDEGDDNNNVVSNKDGKNVLGMD